MYVQLQTYVLKGFEFINNRFNYDLLLNIFHLCLRLQVSRVTLFN